MRMIDADALIGYIVACNIGCGCSEDHQKRILEAIDDCPTVQFEPCEDCISRQATIDAISFGITYAKVFNRQTGEMKPLFESENKELMKAIERVNALPSVTPKQQECEERKKGECSYYARGFCQQVSGDRCNACSMRGKA